MEKLGINPGFLVSQIVNFTLLAILLYVLLYKPIFRMLDERKSRIRKQMEDVELASKQATEAEQEYERRIEQARKEGQRIIAQAAETSQKVADDIKSKAEADAVDIRRRADEELDRQRAQLGAELRRQAGDLSIVIARQLIGATLDEDAQHKLVAKFLKETEGMS